MAQFHKVVKAFQATDKETKQPVTDKYGNGKWMFQVEGQGPEGWMSVSKKEGTTLEVGSHVYGIIDTWPEGKAKFVRQQPPEGEYPPEGSVQSKQVTQPAPQQSSQQGGASVDSKLDYIISLLENGANFQGNGQESTTSGDTVLEDIDDGPVDLSSLDY